MKVCYYNHVGKVSGAEHVLFALLRRVNPRIEKYLVSPASDDIEAFCGESAIPHYRVGELRARFTRNPLRLVQYAFSAFTTILQLRRVLSKIAPDILHANSTRAGMVGQLATIGTPTVVIWHIHDQFRLHPITAVIRVLLRLSRRNAMIAVSQATADSVKRYVGQHLARCLPIWCIHNGVDGALYAPCPDDVADFLKRTNLQQVEFIVTVIGQLTPRKGQAEILEVFADFRKTCLLEACLLLVGTAVFAHDQMYLEELQARVKQLGIEAHVLFLGQRHDVPIILQSTSVLVSNSSSEPFGLVLLEACASGVPVIAAAVDGVPELIEDGLTGMLFEYGDSAKMLELLNIVSRDLAYGKRIGATARTHTLRTFTQERFADRVQQFYAFLLPSVDQDGPGRSNCASQDQLPDRTAKRGSGAYDLN